MVYKFLKVSSLYDAYLKEYYFRNPQVPKFSYSEQLKHLMSDGFAWADHLERNLEKFGWECETIILNAEHLQNAWARENNCKDKGLRLLIRQIRKTQPDVLFVMNCWLLNGDKIEKIRNEVPSIKLIVGFHCTVVNDNLLKSFMPYDFMLTCTPGFVSQFRQAGLETNLMYHAFEPAILDELDPAFRQEEKSDLVFMGSLAAREGFHGFRIRLMEELLKHNFDISLFCSTNQNISSTYIRKMLYYTYGLSEKTVLQSLLKRIPPFNRVSLWSGTPRLNRYSKQLGRSLRGPKYGIEMYDFLRRGKIGLNIHADVAGDYAGNVRLFEVTGLGVCLLTDCKSNIGELFAPDIEVVVYENIHEAIEKVQWLLDNEEIMNSIALAGQRRTLNCHTFYHRAKELDNLIREKLILY